MNTISDEQLVGLYLKNKDDLAIEELVRRYLPLIFGFVKRYTGNQDNASDITQETFVKVWKNIKNFDRTKSFKTWIFTIAKRTAIDELKKKKALPLSVIDKEGSILESLADESPSILARLSLENDSQKLAFAMAKLPPNYSSVIHLYHYQELNFREISETLKKPLNTIKSQYRRGISLLRNYLLENK